MQYQPEKLANLLRRQGYRLTQQRRAVLDVMTRSQEHLTPAELYQKAHQKNPCVSLVTVYRTLEVLAGMGLICEVHSGGNCRSYLMRKPVGHHHHLICSGCGTVVNFSSCDLGDLEKKLAVETGFEIDSHLLEFLGRCRKCRSQVDSGGDVC